MDLITRRRIAEEQRKLCIFNPKLRQIGVDVEGLNHQLHKKNLAKIREIEWEKEYAQQLRRNNHIAALLEQQRSQEFKDHCQKIDQYRLTIQKPEYRRDFDLFDPNHKKKESPPRKSDYDNCPVSGIQRLEGEDLGYRDRLNKQREQLRDVLLQQMQEKRILNYKYHEEEGARNAAMLQQDRDANKIAMQEQNDSRKLAISLQNENKFLAWQHQQSKLNWKMEEERRDKKDMDVNLYGDLLTENPMAAKSNAGPHRVLPDRWKGMNYEQLRIYYDGQIQQMTENQKRKDREREEKAVWDYHVLHRQNTSWLLDTQEKKHTDKLNKDLELHNSMLADQQKQQKLFFNKVVNVNIPNEKYFNQFNTSSR